MPLVDVGAMNASLAGDYGPTRSSSAADWHDVEAWNGDPRLDGSTLLDGTGGQTPTRINPGDWSTPDGGAIQALVTPAAATDAWNLPMTHWALRGSDGFLWDADALTDPLVVTGPGLVTPYYVTIYHADLQADDDD